MPFTPLVDKSMHFSFYLDFYGPSTVHASIYLVKIAMIYKMAMLYYLIIFWSFIWLPYAKLTVIGTYFLPNYALLSLMIFCDTVSEGDG